MPTAAAIGTANKRHHHGEHHNQCLNPIAGAYQRVAAKQPHKAPPRQAHGEGVHRGVFVRPMVGEAVDDRDARVVIG